MVCVTCSWGISLFYFSLHKLSFVLFCFEVAAGKIWYRPEKPLKIDRIRVLVITTFCSHSILKFVAELHFYNKYHATVTCSPNLEIVCCQGILESKVLFLNHD